MSELCDRCKGHPVARNNEAEAMLFCEGCLREYQLWFRGESTVRKAIAAALRKRAAWFPQDDPRWQDAIIELRLAADLIEKDDLP